VPLRRCAVLGPCKAFGLVLCVTVRRPHSFLFEPHTKRAYRSRPPIYLVSQFFVAQWFLSFGDRFLTFPHFSNRRSIISPSLLKLPSPLPGEVALHTPFVQRRFVLSTPNIRSKTTSLPEQPSIPDPSRPYRHAGRFEICASLLPFLLARIRYVAILPRYASDRL